MLVIDAPARVCDACGELIPTERLEALPGVSYCVDCQGEIERRQSELADDAFDWERIAESEGE